MLSVADGANPWSLSSCDQFLSVFQVSEKYVKLTDHTYACNSLTNFEYEAHPFIGNGNSKIRFMNPLVSFFL